MSETFAPAHPDLIAVPGLQDIEIPAALKASVNRHRANLARLITSLQSAGVEGSQIEASVNAVVGSYRHELVAAITAMMKSPADV